MKSFICYDRVIVKGGLIMGIEVKTIDVSGDWICKLDPLDLGLAEEWYLNNLAGDRVVLPGTLAENHMGETYQKEEGLTKENVRSLRAKYRYIGAAWYQKTIELEEEVDIGDYQLFLERIMFESKVWINGSYIGSQDSLSCPHIYSLVNDKKCKTLTITICVDNRDINRIGTYSSAYTEETQTLWNGIVGKMYLTKRKAYEFLTFNIGVNGREHMGLFDISLLSKEILETYKLTIEKNGQIIQSYVGRVANIEETLNIEEQSNLIQQSYRIDLQLPLAKDIELWNEFHPTCYELRLQVMDLNDTIVIDDRRTTGFCQMEAKGKELLVNGIPTFLRGNIDCCLYPLTGYPPMDKDMWYKVMSTSKSYGLNHIRFHSWCPPEAAFWVADELGIYLQVEGPMWLDSYMDIKVGSTPTQYTYLPEEAMRIISNYSHHPSFCIFSNGNELNGDNKLLEDIIDRVKKMNPNILYTLTTNWDRKTRPFDDIFIAQSSDGVGIRGQYFLQELVNTTTLNFDLGVSQKDIPVISHEIGQYVVYPNVEDIDKYVGNLLPVNFEVIREDLEKKNMNRFVSDFVRCSGRLAYDLYKAECEAALNTSKMAGFQLLSLHDFPGQSTATVGLLDVFFDRKGITDDDEFKQFCNQEVLLLQMDKKIYCTHDKVNMSLHIANYREYELENQSVRITVKDEKGFYHYEEIIEVEHLKIGLNVIGPVLRQLDFTKLNGRVKLHIEAKIDDNIKNQWTIWVYSEIEVNNTFMEEWNDTIIDRLHAGETIILSPKKSQVKKLSETTYFPVFWSPVHFMSKDPCGMIIEKEHPFFKTYYEGTSYGDYEWKTFMEEGFSIELDSLPDVKPMTMYVPNFYHNHICSGLFEVKVGLGKLLVCCYDFMNNSKSLPTEYLREAINAYVRSDDFNPSYQCDEETLKELFIH